MRVQIDHLVNTGHKVYQAGEVHVMSDEEGQKFIDNGWGVDIDADGGASAAATPQSAEAVDLDIHNVTTRTEDSINE